MQNLQPLCAGRFIIFIQVISSGQEKGTPEQMLWRVLHMVVIYAVLYILIYLIERYLKKDIEELQITRRELLVVFQSPF